MPALYSHTTRATGTILTATIYNGDHQNHIDNGVPAQLDDYSVNVAQMQTTVDPGEVGSESLATSMAGEFERLRFAIKEMKGTAQWYESRPMWERISDTTVTVAGLVEVPLPDGFSIFRVHFVNLTPVASGAGNQLYCRFYQNNIGVAGIADYFDYGVAWTDSVGTVFHGTGSFIPLERGGTLTTEATNGWIEFNAGGVGIRTQLTGMVRHVNNASARCIHIVGSEVLVTAFRNDKVVFGWVGGTNFLAQGKIILEGLR